MFIFGVTWFSLLQFIKYNSIIFPAILSLKRIRSFTAIFNPSLNARWKLLRERNRFLFATVAGTSPCCHLLDLLGFWGRDLYRNNDRRQSEQRRVLFAFTSFFEERFPWSFFFQIFTNFLAESKRFDGIFPSNLVLIFTLTRAYLLFV